MLGCFKNNCIFIYIMNWFYNLWALITVFFTLLIATKRPHCLWIAIETAPNLPYPKCFIIKKSYNDGIFDVYFLHYFKVKYLWEFYDELVGLPNLVEI